ncbi:hypothetical protein HDV06_001430 [Boothiomyces sp. JEL0866]|nr:hypothetical protein HDV06_001430 [Boothiomyces sp. JEL0866]
MLSTWSDRSPYTITGLVIQSLWDTKNCYNAPPLSITLLNKNVSSIYTYEADSYSPSPICGQLGINIYSGCCFQIYSPHLSPYQSFERHVITKDVYYEYSINANGYEYCVMKGLDSDQVLQAHILDNSNCIDEKFRCSGDYLYIYDQVDCAGPYLSYYLHNNSKFGNYTISKEKITSGTSEIQWITSAPYQPQLQHAYGYPAFEIFAIITSVISMIGFVFSIVFCLRKYLCGPNAEHLFLLATQVVWQIRCILTLIDVYCIPFSTLDSSVVVGLWCLSDLCTLMSTLISANILLKVLNLECDRLRCIFVYGFVLIIALVLASPTIFYFIYFLAFNVDFVNSLYSLYVDQLYFGWELFMFLFDIIPPAIILYKMSFLKVKKADQLNQIQQWKSRIYAMFGVEGINIITYVTLFTLQYQTPLLGGDNQFESVWVVQLLNFFIHNMIILSLFESLKEMMKVAALRVAMNPKQSGLIPETDINKETLIETSVA